MTESMREAFENYYPVPDGIGWVDKLGYYSTKDIELIPDMDYYNELFDVWKTASTKPQQWIKCSDRLPTEEDSDCNAEVWAVGSSGQVCLSRFYLSGFSEKPQATWKYWMPTNLKRPEPPKE